MRWVHVSDDGFEEAWARGVRDIRGATYFYTLACRRYEAALFAGRMIADDSFCLVTPSGETAALVPLYLFEGPQGKPVYAYGTGAEFLRAPLFLGSEGSGLFDKALDIALARIESLARSKAVAAHRVMVEPVELLEGRHYYDFFAAYGYVPDHSVATVIDCREDPAALWAGLRKSYKPLINREKRLVTTQVVDADNYDENLCEEYRRLHGLASGRATRPRASFEEMYRLIRDGQAYLVLVHEAGIAMGAYLFLSNGHYVFYGSAATDPAVAQQRGVGHLGLWTAIEAAKRRGAFFMDFGQVLLRPGGLTPKEINIDLFKRGFGGRRVTVFRSEKRFDV
ncbi:MAG: GNAT family N-acetyltransferase [Candidatus Omnitrophica bacterium]|nr:GNAT family N-acetyltransferase [Candidatus Omnitrophota bacterium]